MLEYSLFHLLLSGVECSEFRAKTDEWMDKQVPASLCCSFLSPSMHAWVVGIGLGSLRRNTNWTIPICQLLCVSSWDVGGLNY